MATQGVVPEMNQNALENKPFDPKRKLMNHLNQAPTIFGDYCC